MELASTSSNATTSSNSSTPPSVAASIIRISCKLFYRVTILAFELKLRRNRLLERLHMNISQMTWNNIWQRLSKTKSSSTVNWSRQKLKWAKFPTITLADCSELLTKVSVAISTEGRSEDIFKEWVINLCPQKSQLLSDVSILTAISRSHMLNLWRASVLSLQISFPSTKSWEGLTTLFWTRTLWSSRGSKNSWIIPWAQVSCKIDLVMNRPKGLVRDRWLPLKNIRCKSDLPFPRFRRKILSPRRRRNWRQVCSLSVDTCSLRNNLNMQSKFLNKERFKKWSTPMIQWAMLPLNQPSTKSSPNSSRIRSSWKSRPRK